MTELDTKVIERDLARMNWLGANNVYQIVRVAMFGHSDKTYYPSSLDFHIAHKRCDSLRVVRCAT